MIALNRESVDKAESVCKKLLPHGTRRTTILQFLSQSIFAIPNACGSDRWGLSLFPNLIRLNVGPIEVLTISKEKIGVVLLESKIEETLRSKLVKYKASGNGQYRYPTGSRYFGITVRQFCALVKDIRKPHIALIETASSGARRPMFYKAHSRGLTAYLAREFNINVCDPSLTLSQQDVQDLEFMEGQKSEYLLMKPYRNRFLRKLFLRPKEYSCKACGFNFGSTYGPCAEGYIEVHHSYPVAAKQRQTRLKDLVALCANCHRVAHLGTPRDRPRTLKELRTLLDTALNQSS
jgi:predicted HNH restriction endonuclease